MPYPIAFAASAINNKEDRHETAKDEMSERVGCLPGARPFSGDLLISTLWDKTWDKITLQLVRTKRMNTRAACGAEPTPKGLYGNSFRADLMVWP